MKTRFLLFVLIIIASCKKHETTVEFHKTIRKQQWNLVSSFPKSLDSFWDRIEAISYRVHSLTDKELTIKLYQPGELVPALEVFDAVSQGSVEMGFSVGNYYFGKNKAFILETGVPFGLTASQRNSWLYEYGGLELLQELYKKYDIMYFPVGNSTTQMGGWFRNEINTLDDLKGLRIRISGLGGKVYSKMGAIVQMISGGEIYSALEQGSIDAAEFVGPYDDERFGFYNVAKYYYSPGWQEPGSSIALFINLQKWNSISSKAKEVIELAAKESNLLLTAKYNKENPEAVLRLKEKGVKFRTFNNEIMKEAKRKTQLILEEYCHDADFKKIYTSLSEFQRKSNFWIQTNEFNLLEFNLE